MPLHDLGSVLSFAEELETQDREFYGIAASNPACAELRALLGRLEADAARNAREVQRIRRENVTETILEPVHDFTRASFCEACEGAAGMDPVETLETATRLEARADRYYAEAAEKLQALTEVSRALRTLGKSRRAHIAKLLEAKR